jgi:glycosyltransferase involved in cell wall biosynthesis
MGGIKNWKRPQFFIDLARRCRDLDADFVLVGEIQERKYDAVLKAAMEELPNFRYDGVVPRKQVGACFEKAHILVSTSRAEGYPNTFIHAMMHGVPIVSLDVDPEGLLADKGFGRLAKDMDGLEKAVRELAGDPQKRREIGAMEREYAVREFDLKSVVDRLEGILKERGVKMPEIRNPKSEIQK